MVYYRFQLVLLSIYLLPIQLIMHSWIFFGFDNMDELDAFGFDHGIFPLLNVGEKVQGNLCHTNSRRDGMSRKMALEDSMLRIQLHLNKSCVISNISIDYFKKIRK